MAFVYVDGAEHPVNVAFNRLTTCVAYLTGLTNEKIYGGHLIVDDQLMPQAVMLTPKYRAALTGTDHEELALTAALLADMYEFNTFDVTLHRRIVEPVRERLIAAGSPADDNAAVSEIAEQCRSVYEEMRPAIIHNTTLMTDVIGSGRYAIDDFHVLPSSLLSLLRGHTVPDRLEHWLRTAPSFARKAALGRYRELEQMAMPIPA